MFVIKEKSILSSFELKLINKLFDCCRQEFEDIYTFMDSEENYNRKFSPYYLLEADGRLVGFMSVFIPDDRECQVYINILQDYISEENLRDSIECIKRKCNKYKIRNISVVSSVENRRMTENLQNIGLKYVYSDVGMYMELQDFFVREKKQRQSIDGSIMINEKPDIEVVLEDNSKLYTVWDDDKYIGELSVLKEKNTICIYGVYTNESYRRKGYCRYLMEQVLKTEKSNGIKNAVLHVTSDNIPAVKLYESIGFKEKEKIDRWEICKDV